MKNINDNSDFGRWLSLTWLQFLVVSFPDEIKAEYARQYSMEQHGGGGYGHCDIYSWFCTTRYDLCETSFWRLLKCLYNWREMHLYVARIIVARAHSCV